MASDVFWVTDLPGAQGEKFAVWTLPSLCEVHNCVVCLLSAVLKSSEDGMASDVFWVTVLRVRISQCELCPVYVKFTVDFLSVVCCAEEQRGWHGFRRVLGD
jgi:hypothetical protein